MSTASTKSTSKASRSESLNTLAGDDVLKARIKACQRVQWEMARLSGQTENPDAPELPYQGFKLYMTYQINEGKKCKNPATLSFYLLEGEDMTRCTLLELMEQEAIFLDDAGVKFERVEVEDDAGRVFWVCGDGMEL